MAPRRLCKGHLRSSESLGLSLCHLLTKTYKDWLPAGPGLSGLGSVAQGQKDQGTTEARLASLAGGRSSKETGAQDSQTLKEKDARGHVDTREEKRKGQGQRQGEGCLYLR